VSGRSDDWKGIVALLVRTLTQPFDVAYLARAKNNSVGCTFGRSSSTNYSKLLTL
jgi:hypothetical protein